MLDVSINKPIKDYYKVCWNQWSIDGVVSQTSYGNRRKPSYLLCAQWCSQALKQIQSSSIQKSFAVCGLFYGNLSFNAVSYCMGLNSKLKAVLFINDGQRGLNYQQFMDLSFIMTGNFESVDNFYDICQRYIVNYKALFRNRSSIEDFVDESPVLIFPNEASQNQIKSNNNIKFLFLSIYLFF